MTTTGERLVTLSELPTVETAMVHYLAIDTSGSGGGGTVLVGELDIMIEGPIVAVSADEGLVGVIADDLELTVEEEIEIEVEDDGLTGETC